MNESTIQKAAGATAATDPRPWGRIEIRCLAIVCIAPMAAAQASCPGIHVKILGIRNGTGAVACELFELATGFPAYHPTEDSRAAC